MKKYLILFYILLVLSCSSKASLEDSNFELNENITVINLELTSLMRIEYCELTTEKGLIIWKTDLLERLEKFPEESDIIELMIDRELYSNEKYLITACTYDHVVFYWEIVFLKKDELSIEPIDNSFTMKISEVRL